MQEHLAKVTSGILLSTILIAITIMQPVFASPIISDNSIQIQRIAGNFDKSSGFVFMDNDILVIQKDDGKVKLIRNLELKKYSILDLNVYNREADSGLLGIASTFVNNTTYVFLFLTENLEADGGKKFEYGLGNRVYRYEWNATSMELLHPKLILDLPSAPSPIDTGGKIIVGPDGQLYTVIGDILREGKEQNLPDKDPSKVWPYDNKTLASGILRTTLNGSPSSGNPFTEEGFEKYYAYGIRNSFGLAFDPLTNNLWDTEKGPSVFDELNLVLPGFNSGWKQIQGRTTDNCCISDYYYASKLSQDVNKLYNLPGSYYDDPKFVWSNSSSVTALTFLSSNVLGEKYKNDLFVGDMQGNIYHFKLDEKRENIIGNDSLHYPLFASGFGSISDIKMGPDGALYVLTFSSTTGFPIGQDSGTLYRLATDEISLPIEASRIINTDYVTTAILVAVIITVTIGIVFTRKRLTREIS